MPRILSRIGLRVVDRVLGGGIAEVQKSGEFSNYCPSHVVARKYLDAMQNARGFGEMSIEASASTDASKESLAPIGHVEIRLFPSSKGLGLYRAQLAQALEEVRRHLNIQSAARFQVVALDGSEGRPHVIKPADRIDPFIRPDVQCVVVRLHDLPKETISSQKRGSR